MVQLLLRTNIESLGRIGDVVDVKPGYARNYLLPYGHAVPITPDNQKSVEKERRAHMEREQLRMVEAKDLAAKLENMALEISVRTNDEGRLYGSVTPLMISQSLAQKGFAVSASAVRLKANIDEVGIHEVPIHLHHDVDTSLQVKVTSLA